MDIEPSNKGVSAFLTRNDDAAQRVLQRFLQDPKATFSWSSVPEASIKSLRQNMILSFVVDEAEVSRVAEQLIDAYEDLMIISGLADMHGSSELEILDPALNARTQKQLLKWAKTGLGDVQLSESTNRYLFKISCCLSDCHDPFRKLDLVEKFLEVVLDDEDLTAAFISPKSQPVIAGQEVEPESNAFKR